MKPLFAILLCALFAAGCGSDDNPADAGGIAVVDETFTVSGGAFRPYTVTINADVQQNAFIQGKFEVKNGTIDFAIMNETTYQSWQAGETLSTIFYSPGTVSNDSFRINMTESGTFYLVFSNLQQSTAQTVEAEIYLFSSIEQDI